MRLVVSVMCVYIDVSSYGPMLILYLQYRSLTSVCVRRARIYVYTRACWQFTMLPACTRILAQSVHTYIL